MKNLKIFEEEINNCSRCGLCQAVCPVYKITKNDCTSPKGKCIMLNNLLKSTEKPSKEMKKYMEMCTNCGKCYDFCPSKINIIKINEAYNKDFPKLSILNSKIFQKIYLLIFGKIFNQQKNKTEKLNFSSFKKIAYIKPYNQKGIPKCLENTDYDTFDFLNCDLNFIFKNQNLSELISFEMLKNITNKDYDCIITDNEVCKFQIDKYLSKEVIVKEVVYIDDFKK